LQNCKHHIFSNKFSQLKQCAYWKTAQEIQCKLKNLTNKCWQKKDMWTCKSLMDLKLMQNEVNATLNLADTSGLILLNDLPQVLFVDWHFYTLYPRKTFLIVVSNLAMVSYFSRLSTNAQSWNVIEKKRFITQFRAIMFSPFFF
jgi:hypothetical protein